MKKIFLFICIIFSLSLYSQRTGISYQALILDPNGEQLPGYNNENAPLTNTAICLEFIIRDDRNVIEYSEYQSVTTDKYGMVNLIIGTGDYAGGYSGGWDGIVWSEKSKKLIVKLDTSASCSDFIEISNQELTSVAFALYAPGQEGRDGESAYEIWLSEGNVGTVQQFLDSLKGEKGDDGLSAFEIWIDLGNAETKQDFIDSLKGEDGEAGKSAYQIWLDAGNTGTEEDFLDSLKGSNGNDGDSGNQSLIKTTVEAAGDNCANGGIKIESGIDSNADGTLDDEEVDSSQTKYLCNGIDGTDGTDGVDGADGSGSGSGTNCFSFDILGVVETTMDASGITHDADYSQYPNVASGLLSSNISGTNMNFTSLNTNKFVISSTGQERLPEYELAIKGYGSDGALLDLSIKVEQYWWMGYGDSGYDPKRKGGGFPLLGATSEPRTTTFYYEGSSFDSNIGGKIYNRGGVEGPNEYGMNLEISSNKTIDRITLTYTPVNWTTAGAGYTRSKIINSFIKYTCTTVSSSTQTAPPSDLALGDYFGGGIVFYIAQSGDPIYVEGEIHGLIAPFNWRGINSGGNSQYRWSQYSGALKDMYNSFTESMFNVGGGKTLTNLIAQTYIGEDSSNQFTKDNYPNYSGNPWIIAHFSKINNYEDWYVPNSTEFGKLAAYIGVVQGSGNTRENNVLASNFVNGCYMDSGYWRGGSYNYAVTPRAVAWNSGSGQCNESSFYLIRSF